MTPLLNVEKGYDEGWQEHGISRLVTMSRRGKHSRQGERRMGIPARMPVATVFENLESGASIEEIMEWFDVSREQINAVLPQDIRSRADKQSSLLKTNPQHPSVRFKKLGERHGQEIWPARVTLNYRALAIKRFGWIPVVLNRRPNTHDSLIS